MYSGGQGKYGGGGGGGRGGGGQLKRDAGVAVMATPASAQWDRDPVGAATRVRCYTPSLGSRVPRPQSVDPGVSQSVGSGLTGSRSVNTRDAHPPSTSLPGVETMYGAVPAPPPPLPSPRHKFAPATMYATTFSRAGLADPYTGAASHASYSRSPPNSFTRTGDSFSRAASPLPLSPHNSPPAAASPPPRHPLPGVASHAHSPSPSRRNSQRAVTAALHPSLPSHPPLPSRRNSYRGAASHPHSPSRCNSQSSNLGRDTKNSLALSLTSGRDTEDSLAQSLSQSLSIGLGLGLSMLTKSQDSSVACQSLTLGPGTQDTLRRVGPARYRPMRHRHAF